MKVFISSTYSDLIEYRKAAIEVANDHQCVVLAMEHFKSQPYEPQKVCDKEIKECDIFVGIYAHRYGFIPKGKRKSITQLEYELAKKEGKQCLCFIIDSDFPWLPKYIESDKKKELKTFLDKVKKENTISSFTTEYDLKANISVSLSKVIEKKKEIFPKRAVIRQPYIAHPYPLPKNFTGREKEKNLLCDWFYSEKKPVLVIEAIGGMGKSALTWVWLQELLKTEHDLSGVFWWSFYEASFESFLYRLACYVLDKSDDREKGLLSTDLEDLHAALYNYRFLLILDGFERALRGYSGMTAMYIKEKELNKGKETGNQKQQRQEVHPQAERLLQHLTSSRTKTLITSRLMPMALEELSGVNHVFLKGLSPSDAVVFMNREGIKGTRAEIEKAGKVYKYHPLMMKLLCTAIKRSRKKDIKSAFKLNLIDEEKPQKILNTSYNLLSEEEKRIVTAVSVFRSAITFDSAKALFPGKEEEQLWDILQELCSLGFLFYDEKEDKFDFHPTLRSFLYDRLTNKTDVHNRAIQYFQALPKPEKVISLDDLSQVIELYHHLVRAEKHEDAITLFQDWIDKPTYYQFSAYNLRIELLCELFPEGEGNSLNVPGRIRGRILNSLANTYSLSGQPERVVPLYFQYIKILERDKDKKYLDLSSTLINVARLAQVHIGKHSAAITHLRKTISLSKEKQNESQELIARQQLSRVLMLQGRFNDMENMKQTQGDTTVETELDKCSVYWEKEDNYHMLSLVHYYLSIGSLLQARLAAELPGGRRKYEEQSFEALKQSVEALKFAEKIPEKRYRHFVFTYWVLGQVLVQFHLSGTTISKSFKIHFFDETFKNIEETFEVKSNHELDAAERCLNEALRRCRKVNMVYYEAYIIMGLGHLEWADTGKITEGIEAKFREAQNIALLSNYRLELADLHILCAQMLLKQNEKDKLLRLSAGEHLRKVKEYALDMSEFSDLYQSYSAQINGPTFFQINGPFHSQRDGGFFF